MAGEALADRARQWRLAGRAANFDDVSAALCPGRRRSGRWHQARVLLSPTTRSAILAIALLELANGNRVEEFVGDERCMRPLRHIVQAFHAKLVAFSTAFRLQRPAARAHFDEMNGRRFAKPGQHLCSAQDVAISVPRPGPNSIRLNAAGCPIASHWPRRTTPRSARRTSARLPAP